MRERNKNKKAGNLSLLPSSKDSGIRVPGGQNGIQLIRKSINQPAKSIKIFISNIRII